MEKAEVCVMVKYFEIDLGIGYSNYVSRVRLIEAKPKNKILIWPSSETLL